MAVGDAVTARIISNSDSFRDSSIYHDWVVSVKQTRQSCQVVNRWQDIQVFIAPTVEVNWAFWIGVLTWMLRNPQDLHVVQGPS
jgi:hypothetical protein